MSEQGIFIFSIEVFLIFLELLQKRQQQRNQASFVRKFEKAFLPFPQDMHVHTCLPGGFLGKMSTFMSEKVHRAFEDSLVLKSIQTTQEQQFLYRRRFLSSRQSQAISQQQYYYYYHRDERLDSEEESFVHLWFLFICANYVPTCKKPDEDRPFPKS